MSRCNGGNERAARVSAVLGPVLLGALALLGLAACDSVVSMRDLLGLVDADIAGQVASLEVRQADTLLASGTGEYAFGEIIVDGAGGYSSAAVTFTIVNRGGVESDLQVSALSLSAGDSGDFVLDDGGAFAGGDVQLGYNESLTFTVRFDPAGPVVPPATTSARSVTVAVDSDDPDAARYTFAARGTGKAFTLAVASVPAATDFVLGYAVIAEPTTLVDLGAFEMGVHEVTYEEWLNVRTWAVAHDYTFAAAGVMGKEGAGTNQEPVTTVSWRDAIVWCNAASELRGVTPAYYTSSALTTVYRDSSDTTADIADTTATKDTNACVDWSADGYRLPTEAEWEYAARRTSGTPTQGDRASGDTSPVAAWATYAWYNTNSASTTHPVEGLTANAQGISDMSGNVTEWCWDWYAAPYVNPDAGADPHGPATGTLRINRGGGWSSTTGALRTSNRAYAAPGTAQNTLGFRVVRVP